MTQGRVHIIFAGDDTWRVGLTVDDQPQVVTLEHECESTFDQIVDKLAATLTEYEYNSEELVLAIPSNWCLCASLTADKLPKGRERRQTLIYQLEEHLPLPAERFTADFIDPGGANHILGVCTETNRVRAIVNALEQRDILISSICPLGLLAVQSMDNPPTQAITSPDALLWQNCQYLEWVTLDNQQPTAWHLIKQTDTSTIERLGALQTLQTGRSPLNIQLHDVDASVADNLTQQPELEVTHQTTTSMLDAATAMAQHIHQGQHTASVNLRCDQLAANDRLRSIRKPLNALIVAGLCLLACLSIALHWRAAQYQQITQDNESQLVNLFRSALPKQSVPVSAIPSRLQAEYRSMQGLSGNSSDLPIQTSAYHLLVQTLDRLPDKLRYRILNVDIVPASSPPTRARIQLLGQARTHSDAAAIATALGKANGSLHFAVSQPRTEKRRQQGVNFTLNIAVQHKPSSGGKP